VSESAISLCAAALRLIGAEPIASFDEGTPAADACAALYPGLRDALLAAHPWNFAQTVAQLARLVDPPPGWRAAFAAPPDMLTLRALYANPGIAGEPIRRFDWRDQTILADADEAWAVYLRRVPEPSWPPPFALLLRYALAAELAMTITERREVTEEWRARAYGAPSEGMRGGQFRVAAAADAQAGPVPVLPRGALVLARSGRR
jgi:hypothetical protein